MRGTIILAAPENKESEGMIQGLSNYGYEVLRTDSGEEAAGMIKKTKGLGAVVLNSELKGMSPVDLCKQMKASGQLEGVSVFILESEGMDRQPFTAVGINKFLTKPFNTGAIARAVRTTEANTGPLVGGQKKLGAQLFWVGIILGIGVIVLSFFIFFPLFFGGGK